VQEEKGEKNAHRPQQGDGQAVLLEGSGHESSLPLSHKEEQDEGGPEQEAQRSDLRRPDLAGCALAGLEIFGNHLDGAEEDYGPQYEKISTALHLVRLARFVYLRRL
jgi:hypothetical protein